MDNLVNVEGPHGAYQVNELMRRLLEVNGMSVVIPGDVNATIFLGHILEMLPELNRSGIHDNGYFIWERGNTVVFWAVTARVGYENECTAAFVSASMETDHLSRMFIDLQDSARAFEIEPEAVFVGRAAPKIADRLKDSTVFPAQLLLGTPWAGA